MSTNSTLRKFLPLGQFNLTDRSLPDDILDGLIPHLNTLSLPGCDAMTSPKIQILIAKLVNATNLKTLFLYSNLNNLNLNTLNTLSLLNNIPKKILTVFLDGDKNIHEYIFHGSKFDTFVDNLKTIKNNFPQLTLKFTTNITAYNIGRIKNILDTTLYLKQELNTHIGFNEIRPGPIPSFIHPATLPQSLKNLYLTDLNSIDLTPYTTIKYSGQLVSIAKNTLQQNSTAHFDDFLHYTLAFDSATDTSYQLLYPELMTYMTELLNRPEELPTIIHDSTTTNNLTSIDPNQPNFGYF